jgi:hypothetical protein
MNDFSFMFYKIYYWFISWLVKYKCNSS